MKNYKKDITKLKYIKINADDQDNDSHSGYEPTQIYPQDQNFISKSESINDVSSVNLNINKPTYKKFEDKSDFKNKDINVVRPSSFVGQMSQNTSLPDQINLRLPKFLAQREDQKIKLNNLKTNGGNKQDKIDNLPFTPEDFESNPNSFTSIFNKDNNKINGFQRVFRKSILFLVMQLCSYALISFLCINGFLINFTSIASIFSSGLAMLLLVIAYSSITSIFYIIVADRSYIWISLLAQSLSLILMYSFTGLGFSFVTLFVALIVFVLSYFAYLEIEKIQVSTRFFSIGYVTSEAVKILSTVAILTICLGFFNGITQQTPKVFLTKNLIDNQTSFDTIVMGNSFPFNKINLNSVVLNGKYTISDTNIVQNDGKNLTYKDFVLKNYKNSTIANINLTDKEVVELQKTYCSDKVSDKDCQEKLKPFADAKIKKYLSSQNPNYSDITLGLDDTLDVNSFKKVLKAYYSDRIDLLTSQQNSIKDIAFLKGYTSYIEPILPNIIQAIFVLVLFIFLFTIKFLMHILTSIFVWVLWKILLLLGFAKINVELVESEIVSI